MVASRVYLLSAIILLVLIFVIVILPYLTEYIKYTNSLKSFGEGANISYQGNINIWAIRRNASGAVDYEIEIDLEYYLEINYQSDKIYSSLYVYNMSSGNLIFNRTISIQRNSDLLLFIVPPNNVVSIIRYGYEIHICPKPGPTRFGSPVGTLSEVGVPKEYLGMLTLQNNLLTVTDNWWNRDWQCNDIVKRGDTGVFYRYGRLENGFILLSYTAYYGASMGTGNSTIAEIFREYGSPLINMLADTFEVHLLRDIIQKIRTDTTLCPEIVRETIHIKKSNVYPLDQDWIGGISALYMGLTPITQFMTVASIVLLILYFRRR